MRKVITTITLCSIIFSTSLVYGQNKQVDLEKKLTENRNSQVRLDEQIIELNSKIIEVEEKILSTNEEISKLDLQINEIKSEINELEKYIKEARPKITEDTENALFVNSLGQRFTRQGLWKLIKKYASIANINKNINYNC